MYYKIIHKLLRIKSHHSPCETHTSFLRRIFSLRYVLRSFFAPELPQNTHYKHNRLFFRHIQYIFQIIKR